MSDRPLPTPPPPIPYVRAIDPAYGESVGVSPLLRRVTANNPGPFTYTGTGTYIVGHGEVAVIDPGPDDPVHLAALLRAVEGERVVAIVTTHSHADHSPLARPLQAATGNPPIYGRADPSAGVGEEDSDAAFRPDVEVADGQVITGPGWTLEAIATPGHASNHVAYALAEEDALLAGDHVMGWSTTIVSPPHGDMGDYMASLDRVAARGFATLWPTHGPPITDVAPFLAAYRAHRTYREDQLLAALAGGPRRIEDLVPQLYAAVDARLHPAAARSMLAALLKLEGEARVGRDGEAWRLG